MWNAQIGECVKTLTGHSNTIYSVAYSPCGQFLASGNYDDTVKIWQIEFE